MAFYAKEEPVDAIALFASQLELGTEAMQMMLHYICSGPALQSGLTCGRSHTLLAKQGSHAVGRRHGREVLLQELLNIIIDRGTGSMGDYHYMEVGCWRGFTFHALRAEGQQAKAKANGGEGQQHKHRLYKTCIDPVSEWEGV